MRRRGLAPPPIPYLARNVKNVTISKPNSGACPHMVPDEETKRRVQEEMKQYDR